MSFPEVVILMQGQEEHRSDSLWQNITLGLKFFGFFSWFYFLPGEELAALTKFLHDGILQEFYNWKCSESWCGQQVQKCCKTHYMKMDFTNRLSCKNTRFLHPGHSCSLKFVN